MVRNVLHQLKLHGETARGAVAIEERIDDGWDVEIQTHLDLNVWRVALSKGAEQAVSTHSNVNDAMLEVSTMARHRDGRREAKEK